MMKKIIVTAGGILLLSMIMSGCGGDAPEGQDEMAIVSEEISWPLDDTTVYATVTRPSSGTNLPAVVFVPGSGPTDRDWNSPLIPGTNGSAKLFAEELAKQGFVTLRYDKRFTGPHASENLPKLIGKLSLQGHVDELAGAVEALAAIDDVDSRRIFVLANSEGTIHSVNYQMQAEQLPFAGLILTGAPGRTVGDLAHAQIAAQLEGFPGADDIMRLYDEAVEEFLASGVMNPDESLPDGIKTFLLSLANQTNMPFTQEVWVADIADDLQDIDAPVLIIIGKKDIQVDWEIDGGMLQAAAEGKSTIEFFFPENANHIMKHEDKPRDQVNPAAPNYNEDGAILDAVTLEKIIDWLGSR
jgi:pimeloyl-ACP methyl ester carboxylesterase